MTARRIAYAAAGLLAAGLLACGGGDAPGGATAADSGATSEGGAAAPGVARPQAAREADGTRSTGPNTPPVIRSVVIEPTQPRSGETVRAVVEATDPDGDPVHLDYEWRVKGRAAGGNEPRLLLLGASKRDTVEVLVTPSDGREEGPAVRATARVRNRAPELHAVHIAPAGPITGADDIVLRPQARDVDGDEVRFQYRWTVNGESVDERESVLDTAHLKRGDRVRVTVTASDGDETSDPIQTPELKITNGVPRIVSEPTLPEEEGEAFRYAVKAEEPDGDRLRFSLEEAPAGMAIDPLGGEITWSPGADATGTVLVRILVDDMHGGEARQEFRITLGDGAEAGAGATPAAPGP